MAVEGGRAFLSRSSAATRALGAALGERLPPDSVVALAGELGAGKTCFVQGLAAGLGVREPVTSPSYALLQSYAGRLELHHLDAWMEGRERSFLLDGGLECLRDGGVAAIEWADRVRELLPLPLLWVRLEHAGPGERALALAVEGSGPAAARLAEALEALRPGRDLEVRA